MTYAELHRLITNALVEVTGPEPRNAEKWLLQAQELVKNAEKNKWMGISRTLVIK